MKIKKFKFTVNTPIEMSEYSEELELEFRQDITEEEMEKELEEVYLDWITLNNSGGWEEIE